MSKKKGGDCPHPEQERFHNEIFDGIRSTAKYPNEVYTQGCEKPRTQTIPQPGKTPPDFCYDFIPPDRSKK